MEYTIYIGDHDGETANESPWFKYLFLKKATFLNEKIVESALPSGKMGAGINLIPDRDSIRIVEVGRTERIRNDDGTIKFQLVDSWNHNPGCAATGREVIADIIDKTQGCYLLANVRPIASETEGPQ